mmetsp:Transcript_13462/g.29813  ORF Transcript_13462/g.29813 Transcript_13462/m.29813 type:complete len:512 (-) Transcript_13462:1464-2999(-)
MRTGAQFVALAVALVGLISLLVSGTTAKSLRATTTHHGITGSGQEGGNGRIGNDGYPEYRSNNDKDYYSRTQDRTLGTVAMTCLDMTTTSFLDVTETKRNCTWLAEQLTVDFDRSNQLYCGKMGAFPLSGKVRTPLAAVVCPVTCGLPCSYESAACKDTSALVGKPSLVKKKKKCNWIKKSEKRLNRYCSLGEDGVRSRGDAACPKTCGKCGHSTVVLRQEETPVVQETTAAPSAGPSSVPSDMPSVAESSVPSSAPSEMDSSSPSAAPSPMPSDMPSIAESVSPSSEPSMMDSPSPSSSPSETPSETKSSSPSAAPTSTLSDAPSDIPTGSPSIEATAVPSVIPTAVSSSIPSGIPSPSPSVTPSSNPSAKPKPKPTEPTDQLFCTQDAMECPDGSFVGRDPANDCNFMPCPDEEREGSDPTPKTTSAPTSAPTANLAQRAADRLAQCGTDTIPSYVFESFPAISATCDVCVATSECADNNARCCAWTFAQVCFDPTKYWSDTQIEQRCF